MPRARSAHRSRPQLLTREQFGVFGEGIGADQAAGLEGYSRPQLMKSLNQYPHERPGSATFKQQQEHAAVLAQPRWKEVPFHRFVVASDRRDLLKRKHQYQNRIFNYN